MEDFDGEDHREQNTTKAAVDSLSALPVEVIYQIMEHLTLQDAAKMSALSRSWRKIWLSLPCIVFDLQFVWFLRDGVKRRSERSVYSIMHRILLLHEGPILRFTMHFLADRDLTHWLSYISKSVRELTVCSNLKASASHVLFSFSKLRKLELNGGTISIPPTFTGFSNLMTLELLDIVASGDAVFGRLIRTSSQLEKLVLCHCRGFGDIVIDFPLLRTLHISGTWKSICFKSAPNLKVADLSELCVEDFDHEIALTQFIGSLIHPSSQLEKLVLRHCRGFGDIVIDFPLLRTLHISGTWKSICFKSAPNLKVADLSKLCVEDLDYEIALTRFIGSLIHMCSQLECLALPDKGFKDVILDSPSLRTLSLLGSWQSICFKNAPNLTEVSLYGNYVEDLDYEKALNLINCLVSSCTIETLVLEGTFCKFFLKDDAGEKILTFDHVKHLLLGVNNFKIGNEFVYVTSIMRTCPNMRHLLIDMDRSWEEGENFESYHNCTLDHLRQIYVSGFEGFRGQLKLMEFLLKSSPQLVKLGIVKDEDSEPEWKILEELMMFPRASSEAEVIVVDEIDEFLMEKFFPLSWS